MRNVVLLQLPVPDLALLRAAASGECTNIPLAAGYLAVAARNAGLHKWFRIRILSPQTMDPLGDVAIIEEILRTRPQVVGFTCFLWNIERTLGIVQRLKQRRPDLVVILGGPEITHDNEWVLATSQVDYFCIGEGERTFVRILERILDNENGENAVNGTCSEGGGNGEKMPRVWDSGTQSSALNMEGSPYRNRILRAGPETPLFLETMRGCRYRCRFCYYPKGFEGQSFMSLPDVERIVWRARRNGVREIVLLDPTLNQRPDFVEFLRLFARLNPKIASNKKYSMDGEVFEGTSGESLDEIRINSKASSEAGGGTVSETRRFSLFGELRAEAVTAEIAELLRDAGFREVEVGLQTVSPESQRLIGRRVNLMTLEAGCRALRRVGIRVRIDLMIGLPGDTPESIRQGFDWLENHRDLWTDVQIFHLFVLPGTSLRRDAERLGLRYQARPPYTILATPTMDTFQLIDLMDEAQVRFGMEYDMPPEPELSVVRKTRAGTIGETATKVVGKTDDREENVGPLEGITERPIKETAEEMTEKTAVVWEAAIDADVLAKALRSARREGVDVRTVIAATLPETRRGSCFSLVVRSRNFAAKGVVAGIYEVIKELLTTDPYSPLDVYLVPEARYRSVTPEILELFQTLFYETPGYADRAVAMSATTGTVDAPRAAAKRLIVVYPNDRYGTESIQELAVVLRSTNR